MITSLVRVLGLVGCFSCYWCLTVLMDNLGNNPLAEYGIWGMGATMITSFALIYLLNANKEKKDA